MIRQNSQFTFKSNMGSRRHGWLRLTPAYSYRLVSESVKYVGEGALILDPFAGTATTGLVAAELGMEALLLDINPFLVWFGKAKVRNYSGDEIEEAKKRASEALNEAVQRLVERVPPAPPPLHRIDRWWSLEALHALGALKQSLDSLKPHPPVDDLLKVAFCRLMMAQSNAAFNHQSMSFKETHSPQLPLLSVDYSVKNREVLDAFKREVHTVLQSVLHALSGHAQVYLDDARTMDSVQANSIDFLFTSPPYANRISYIRELRPYMYWLGFLVNSRQAGEIDWQSIGGTWGTATSRLANWESPEQIPLGYELDEALATISQKNVKNGPILASYVHKYFFDIYRHLTSAHRVTRGGAKLTYIVGNSTFYGVDVPTERWYAKMLSHLGFCQVKVEAIRKRNSNKKLFEFAVTAVKE